MSALNSTCFILGTATLIGQVLILKTWIEIALLLRREKKRRKLQRIEELKRMQEEKEKISSELPEEIERFIDDYLKDSGQ